MVTIANPCLNRPTFSAARTATTYDDSEESKSDKIIMINTCAQDADEYTVDTAVWIEQKNYTAEAREAMHDATCNICYMNLFDSDENEDVHCIAGCQCLFHKECLTEFIQANISMNKLPIKCPNVGCEKPLSAENDIKILLNEEDFAKW